MQVTHLDGPDASPGADVEDVFWLLERGKVELVEHADLDHLMGQVETVQFVLFTERVSERPDMLDLSNKLHRWASRSLGDVCCQLGGFKGRPSNWADLLPSLYLQEVDDQ